MSEPLNNFQTLLENLTKIFESLSTLKLPVLILLTIWLTFRYFDKIQIFISFIQKLLSGFSAKMERKSISNNIEGKINSFAKKLNVEVENVLPYGVKVEWVEDKGVDQESFLKNNQVIVKMKQHVNQDRNLVIATLGYVACGLLPKARNYVSKSIIKSIDFKMLHKILLSNKSHSAIQYLFDTILPTETNDKPEIKEYLEKLHDIDDHGFFISVLLVELAILGKRLPPDIESIRKRAIAEMKAFVGFLYKLAIRRPGEEADLHFIKKEIKVGILIVAKAEKIAAGEKQYLNRFKKNVEQGCERVYIISSGGCTPHITFQTRENDG